MRYHRRSILEDSYLLHFLNMVLQLANVLKSNTAVQMSIKIIEIFVRLRQMLTDSLSLKLEVEEIKKKLHNQDKNIELVFSYLDELITKQDNHLPRKRIGFKTNDLD